MKINSNISFARQLIIYLLIVLFIGFLFISLALTNSLEQFIAHNAYSQSNVLAANIMNIFEREIARIEKIPVWLDDTDSPFDARHGAELPARILKAYPTLAGCAIHYTRLTPHAQLTCTSACRMPDGTIQSAAEEGVCDFSRPHTNHIIRKNHEQGYWIYSHIGKSKTIAYCQYIHDKNNDLSGIVKIDFPVSTITDLVCDYKLFRSGYFFIMDKEGRYVSQPEMSGIHPCLLLTDAGDPLCLAVMHKIKNGETGYTALSLNRIKHYIYYTPIPLMNWRLGIIYIERLQITTAEKERMNSEMNLARKIQQRFLPQHPSLPANIELVAELRQCRQVGGDLYEFFQLENRLYFAVGDVSGKGTPAALYMASICKLFRYVASCHSSASEICSIINQHMYDDINDGMYITMFMGILDINTGILTYVNAAHPYPLIIHENGIPHTLDHYATDGPIGIIEEQHYTEHTYTLHKGMSILIYTDGVTDAENSSGQFYGKDNMFATLSSLQEKTPALIVQTLLGDIRKHIGKQNPSDDLTLLVIRYKGIPGQCGFPTVCSFPD